MREADDWELRVGRVWDGREEDVAQRSDEARAVIAAMIGADPDDVALTFGREDSLALAAQAVGGDGAIIDATCRVGVERLDVNTLGAEAIAFAADRWLLGPEGTGALWLANRSASTLSRALPRTALIGLARSVGWLEMFVGLEWIYERSAGLAARLHATLSAMPGVDAHKSTDAPAVLNIKSPTGRPNRRSTSCLGASTPWWVRRPRTTRSSPALPGSTPRTSSTDLPKRSRNWRPTHRKQCRAGRL